MWKYLLRRVLLMVPALLAVMLIAFMISRAAPSDPVLSVDPQITAGKTKANDRIRMRTQYEKASRNLGLDLPIFYLELTSMAYPDTLHRIVNMRERAMFAELAGHHGNWAAINDYRHRLVTFENKLFDQPLKVGEAIVLQEVQRNCIELRYLIDRGDVQLQLATMDSLILSDSLLRGGIRADVQALRASYERIFSEATPWRCYVPSLHWHGWQNQFHHWLGRMLSLDFGTSYVDRRPIAEKIQEALPWSIFMGALSYLISMSLAIPIGVFFVRRRDTAQDRVVTILLFLLNSVPTFVLAMLVMTFFCNPEYFYWFPIAGVRDDLHDTYSTVGKLLDIAYHLILPTLIFSYHGVTFLSRMMRVSMLENMNADYVRTARAKGVSERRIIWRHALRNSLVPIISSLSGFPGMLIAGAVVIETIFSVPGMGSLTTKAIQPGMEDHPMIVAVFTLGGLLNIVGVLLGDVLLALTDPRVTFTKS